MTEEKKIESIIKKETRFDMAQSSGPGGQNINKRKTKVVGLWNFSTSRAISEDDRQKLSKLIGQKNIKGRILCISSQKYRTQNQNKKEVIDAIIKLVIKTLTPEKERISTTIPIHTKEQRIKSKKIHSKIKKTRKVEK
ncbi:MAG TPA: peptide chain release factor-like protein [Candidatus Paceibacterota bacterium]|nr:peptide chain release factor-like protein [Candidatus Paceibacterota bacterium]